MKKLVAISLLCLLGMPAFAGIKPKKGDKNVHLVRRTLVLTGKTLKFGFKQVL